MARGHSSGLVTLMVSIATGSLLIASSTQVQACIRGKSTLLNTTDPVTRPFSVSDRQQDASNALQLKTNNSLNLGHWEIIGAGAIAGILLSSWVYRRYRACLTRSISDKMLFNHPELEHPELALTALPKEALFSTSNR